MDFFKIKKFRKARKPNPEKDATDDKPVPQPEHPKSENGDNIPNKSTNSEITPDIEEEDEDDDFITNEVKRRLKELRRNSFMVLIPEESCIGEEEGEGEGEEGETSSSEWRDVDAAAPYRSWVGFEAVYEKYCERMLFFDRISLQWLNESGFQIPLTPSPRAVSKKLASPFRCLHLKKSQEPEEETEHLQQQLDNDPYHDIETSYVAQVCLTWEALHCQYTQLSQKSSSPFESLTCYNLCAQEFQQFQVLVQRFIENEPFEQGSRPEIYAKARYNWPRFLHVPKVQGSDKMEDEEDADFTVHASDLLRLMESSILTFYLFLKTDKKKSNGVLNIFGGHNHQIATPLQQVQSALEKKKLKLKELRKKKKSKKNKSWPQTYEEVEILFGLIDIKILARVLRMERITKEVLLWCEDKMKKQDFSAEGKLQRDPSPILFPC